MFVRKLRRALIERQRRAHAILKTYVGSVGHDVIDDPRRTAPSFESIFQRISSVACGLKFIRRPAVRRLRAVFISLERSEVCVGNFFFQQLRGRILRFLLEITAVENAVDIVYAQLKFFVWHFVKENQFENPIVPQHIFEVCRRNIQLRFFPRFKLAVRVNVLRLFIIELMRGNVASPKRKVQLVVPLRHVAVERALVEYHVRPEGVHARRSVKVSVLFLKLERESLPRKKTVIQPFLEIFQPVEFRSFARNVKIRLRAVGISRCIRRGDYHAVSAALGGHKLSVNGARRFIVGGVVDFNRLGSDSARVVNLVFGQGHLFVYPMLGSAPIHADDRLARVRDADAQDFFECKALIFQRIGKRIFLQFFEPEFSADDFRRFIPALCGDFGRMFPAVAVEYHYLGYGIFAADFLRHAFGDDKSVKLSLRLLPRKRLCFGARGRR